VQDPVLPSPVSPSARRYDRHLEHGSVLQPAGSWLALQRWLEVILVIKRLRDPPSRGGRRAYIHMR
jgi:hypothetical protein